MARVMKRTTALQRQALIAGVATAAAWSVAIVALWIVSKTRQYDMRTLVAAFIVLGLLVVAHKVSNFSLIYIRGYRAERRVSRQLETLPDEYLVLNDVQLSVDGRSAQIDHVLVSPYGLWCVETKSWLGAVRGKEKDRTWTQVKKSDSGRIYTKKYHNPIAQNATHCRALRAHLGQNLNLDPPVKSVIVFTVAELRIETTTPVVGVGELASLIRTSDTSTCLDSQELELIVRSLGVDEPRG